MNNKNILQFYKNIQHSLVEERKAIQTLSHSSRIKGDYFEAIIRNYLRSVVASRFEIAHGGIFIEGNMLNEYDVIIFDKTEVHPIFKKDDVVILNPEDVKCVMQIKGFLDAEALESAMKNLGSVKKYNSNCFCYLLAFQSTIVSTITSQNQIDINTLVPTMEEISCPIDILTVLDQGETGFSVHKTLQVPPDSNVLDIDDGFSALAFMIEHIKQGALYIGTKNQLQIVKS